MNWFQKFIKEIKSWFEVKDQFKNKETKPRLVKVLVHGISNDKGAFSHIVFIPDGWAFVQEFAEKDRLVREDGLVMHVYDWPAGFFLEFIYKYDDEEDD